MILFAYILERNKLMRVSFLSCGNNSVELIAVHVENINYRLTTPSKSRFPHGLQVISIPLIRWSSRDMNSPTHGLAHKILLQSLQIIRSGLAVAELSVPSASSEQEHAWNANEDMKAKVAFLQLERSSADTRHLSVIGSTEQRLKYESNSILDETRLGVDEHFTDQTGNVKRS